MKKETVICNRCETENPDTSKYCRGCGYELPQFMIKTDNHDFNADKWNYQKDEESGQKTQKIFSNEKLLMSILYISFILLYLMTLVVIPFLFSSSIPAGAELGGLAIMIELFLVNFFIMTITLIISLILVNKKPKYSLPAFIIGVIIAMAMVFSTCKRYSI